MDASLRESLRAELEANRAAFRALLASLADADLTRPSHNPAWTVKELLHHMVLSLEYVPQEVKAAQRGRNLMPMPQAIYDFVVILITRLGAFTQNRGSLIRRYEAAHTVVLQTLAAVRDDEWDQPLQFFYIQTTLEDLFRRQARHLAEHGEQIREGLEKK